MRAREIVALFCNEEDEVRNDMITKRRYYIPSSTGEDMVHVVEWEPDGEVKGILQIAHGVREHMGRYERFALYMAEKGFLVIGNDHLGHGETAAPYNKFGYFAPKDGSGYAVRDMRRVFLRAKKKYPDVPYILLAHSMGSFFARRYAANYGKELDGLILLGTGGKPRWMLRFGCFLLNVIESVKDEYSRSWIMEQVCFALYNCRISHRRTPVDWLSRSPKEVDRFQNDPLCQFTLTLNGYRSLFESIHYGQKWKNIRRIPKRLPILIMSGAEDPVGDYGRTVRTVAKWYKLAGIRDVTCRIYRDARHELLNEIEYEKAQQAIWKWIRERYYK